MPPDFADLATPESIRFQLWSMTKNGILVRLGQGIYLYPKVDPELGVLKPSLEEIAQAIAKRDKARIIPTGLYALNRLGLSAQVPTKAVFMTDGSPRRIKIGLREIVFKKTTPKKLAIKGYVNQLVIEALSELGQAQLDDAKIDKIYKALDNESKELIKRDALLAPAWIAKILNQYLTRPRYEQLA